jgi:hypothetical protein
MMTMKTIEFLFAWLFLWFVTTMASGQLWVWPAAFVVLCAAIFYAERRKRRAWIARQEKRAEKLGEAAVMMTPDDRRNLRNAAEIVAAVERRAAEIEAVGHAEGWGQ